MEDLGKKERFARAALGVFKQFGARKTTMEEIAAAAGVSKPTLYAVFRNKDEALAGSIEVSRRDMLLGLRQLWDKVESRADRLDLYFERRVLPAFDMMHNAPDADAFDDAIGTASREAIRVTRLAEVALMAEAFGDAPALSGHGTTAESYAAFLVDAALQAKRQCATREDLEAFLSNLKRSALAVAGDP